jgi:hypothetical protein
MTKTEKLSKAVDFALEVWTNVLTNDWETPAYDEIRKAVRKIVKEYHKDIGQE